jgi:hypothetical protein
LPLFFQPDVFNGRFFHHRGHGTAQGDRRLFKPVVVLSGGEPLLRDDIFELAEYGTSQGLRMCLATNGTLISNDICGSMKKANIRMVYYLWTAAVPVYTTTSASYLAPLTRLFALPKPCEATAYLFL